MPSGGGLPQPASLGDRFQDRQMLGVVRHQLAPERERVLAGGMGELVDEAFEVDGVVVEVDAAPEAGRHRRVAHGMVDQEVRERVADRGLRPRRG